MSDCTPSAVPHAPQCGENYGDSQFTPGQGGSAQHLRGMEEAPWRSVELNAHGVAKLMRTFGIKPTRDSTGSKRGYRRAAFADAWERYLSTDSDAPDEP